MLAELHLGPLIGTIVYSIIGSVIFGITYLLFEKLTPFSVRKEIEEDHNVALAVMFGACIIGISIIIAAAITS
ncbi:MAG: DUF350 domain-containing protein [Gammaproteobacteria bacterium]|nr:DUF350 domain-containing protein [Gammaproteobacteria bacterium]